MNIQTSFSLTSDSESYITTDGQSASLSWNKAPIWGLRPDFYTVRRLRVCWCVALSLTRGWVCPLQLLLALASAVIFASESRGTREHILLSQIRDFPFRRLLWLAGSRWRYSTPPPHGVPLPRSGFRIMWLRDAPPEKNVFQSCTQGNVCLSPSDGSISRNYLHENVFTEPLLSSGWFLDCDWRLACRRYVVANGEPMGVGAAVFRADRLALDSMWVSPTPCSQQPFTGPYPEPDQSSPYHPILSF
jgi:hypothetical protein